jgi:hypothetical protein
MEVVESMEVVENQHNYQVVERKYLDFNLDDYLAFELMCDC